MNAAYLGRQFTEGVDSKLIMATTSHLFPNHLPLAVMASFPARDTLSNSGHIQKGATIANDVLITTTMTASGAAMVEPTSVFGAETVLIRFFPLQSGRIRRVVTSR